MNEQMNKPMEQEIVNEQPTKRSFFSTHIPWVLVVILMSVTLILALTDRHWLRSKWYATMGNQYYLVTTDLTQAPNFICTLHGKTWRWPLSDAYVMRDIYFFQQVDPKKPELGMRLVRHDLDIGRSWETLVPAQHITSAEPINWDSPLLNAVWATK